MLQKLYWDFIYNNNYIDCIDPYLHCPFGEYPYIRIPGLLVSSVNYDIQTGLLVNVRADT